MIISFLNPTEKQRVWDLKEHNIHPYFALIRPSNAKGNVFFKLDKSRNTYVGKMTLQDGFGFSIGKDCTLILEELRQSVFFKERRYQYDIDLAYVISFGDEITKENLMDSVKDLVSYSFEIWRRSNDNPST